MEKKLIAFTINTLEEAESIILGSKIYKIKPILHLKKYFLLGFGVEFILTFREMLISKYGKSSFKLFVDCGFDQSLTINMANKKINYLKLKSNSAAPPSPPASGARGETRRAGGDDDAS